MFATLYVRKWEKTISIQIKRFLFRLKIVVKVT